MNHEFGIRCLPMTHSTVKSRAYPPVWPAPIRQLLRMVMDVAVLVLQKNWLLSSMSAYAPSGRAVGMREPPEQGTLVSQFLGERL